MCIRDSSLVEAEGLRRAVHLHADLPEEQKAKSWLNGVQVAFRALFANAQAFDATPGMKWDATPRTFQQIVHAQVLRFFDGCMHYDDMAVSHLLITLRYMHPLERQAFFEKSVACKRRVNCNWRGQAVSRVLELMNGLELLAMHCMNMRLCMFLLHLGGCAAADARGLSLIHI